jgi:hypothetical protein
VIRVLLGWGLLMGAIGLVGVLFYGLGDEETPALFFGTAALVVAIAAGLWATGRGRGEPIGPRAIPDVSPPVPWLAAAIFFAALGAAVGWWLSLIGAGMAVAGAVGLAREMAAQRAARRSAVERVEGER